MAWKNGRWYPDGDGGDFEPLRLGPDIYNRRSITARNRSPIDDLLAIALGTLKTDADTLPMPPDKAGLEVLLSGSVAVLNPKAAPEFLPDVYCPDEDTIYQYIRARDGTLNLHMRNESMNDVWTDPMRIFTRTKGVWAATVWRNWGDEDRRDEVDAKDAPDPPDTSQLVAFPNGRGIPYWAQDVYNRMEENARTQAKIMRGSNTLPMITGNAGNPTKIRQAFTSAEHAIVIQGDVQVHRVISDSVIAQLVAEAAERKMDYLDALNVVDKESANRPVMGDRELRMWAMSEYIKGFQAKLTQLYALMGATMEFKPLRTQSMEEIAKELEATSLYLGPAAASARASELLG